MNEPNENNTLGYIVEDGTIIVFVVECPKIVGRGKTKEAALENLIEIYHAIIKAAAIISNACNE